MRRYRFGRPAALVAAGYVVVVVALGVAAMVTGDGGPLRLVMVRWVVPEPDVSVWWEVPALVLLGAGQGWILWQFLRGRAAGAKAELGRDGRLLRAALYFSAVLSVAMGLPFPAPWWADLAAGAARFAVVLLFFRVTGGAPRGLRITALVAGLLSAVAGMGGTVADEFGAWAAGAFFSLVGLGGLQWVVWMSLTLVAQARDGRWRRDTVVWGAAGLALPYLVLPFTVTLAPPFSDGRPYTVYVGISVTLGLLVAVWQARSAHDLASPPVRAPHAGRAATARAPFRRWPLAVAAIALPLLPTAANLAHGPPFWLGPGGLIGALFPGGSHGFGLVPLWTVLDVGVGVGGLAVLVLVTVVRRTRRLVRATVAILALAAAAGVAAALAATAFPQGGDGFPFQIEAPRVFPEWMLTLEGEDDWLSAGVSPLWFSAAFAASALLLRLLYGGGAAPRSRFQAVAAATAAVLALCAVPAADLAGGRLSTEEDCQAPGANPGELTGERAFVCEARRFDAPGLGRDLPDRHLVTYGRRLCGVYTRNDPAEMARVRQTDGLEVRAAVWALAHICPSAAAVLAAEHAREDREQREWEAEERRACAEAPRHRPLIKPVTAVVQPEPLWTDYGDLEAYDPEVAEEAPSGTDLPYESELLASGPGQLLIHTYPDSGLCVTTETYTRRPPVETKGWLHVVEVGYRSESGEIQLADPIGGTPLPDLAVRGKGHYRIRVHYAVLPGKEGEYGSQRLLIMSYPGRGDDVTVHRKPKP
ncbi:hypothetical protein [Sphaerisporangium sp. TRM90804]|uniref:hypothetical protein n=1 Tax=Sphaerisporangium sp. TRM90804 TaxID=3031113 RepID=UPI00244914B1|nr:hypothetical protein [Sphaerisporangium sp. TRM90804]MDH2426889.1 hypothetical protein [Sphaerisporangium sp. TRM90804]